MNSTALLVIDVQRGAFDGERCPPIDRSDELIEHAASLIGAARAAGAPIVFIQHCDAPNQVFEEGTAHWELHERLVPLEGDVVMTTYESSAFDGTALATTLVELNAQQLILCGLQSEFCVYNTAKSALVAGYEVMIAQDGHSTWPSDGKSASAISDEVNAKLEASGAVVQPSATLARTLRETRA
jgi:nicotinamidase-related amidase